MASCKVRGGFIIKNDAPFVRVCQVYNLPLECAVFTLDVYSQVLPHMQDDAVAKVEAALLA